MKLAFAGKGGVGKTTIAAWMADYLARAGHNVWLVDADTALSLGVASGLAPEQLPVPLVQRRDLFESYVGSGIIKLSPDVSGLSGSLAVDLPESEAPLLEGVSERGNKRLLVMGSISSAGGGCACEANALLKAMLAHLIYDEDGYVLVDLEAGVEHLGRGTVANVDHLIIVSEPSLRSLETASTIAKLADELGLHDQTLVMNRFEDDEITLPDGLDLPASRFSVKGLSGLHERMLSDGSVLDLPEQDYIDEQLAQLLAEMGEAKQ
ncbi:MAG: AAA family ATPase [Actinomycetia bacterium]|nr:AAA family ATPase [Actinomycetes bacterium]